jgi:hypothetical protein
LFFNLMIGVFRLIQSQCQRWPGGSASLAQGNPNSLALTIFIHVCG